MVLVARASSCTRAFVVGDTRGDDLDGGIVYSHVVLMGVLRTDRTSSGYITRHATRHTYTCMVVPGGETTQGDISM